MHARSAVILALARIQVVQLIRLFCASPGTQLVRAPLAALASPLAHESVSQGGRGATRSISAAELRSGPRGDHADTLASGYAYLASLDAALDRAVMEGWA